jgi:hypothetical protein
MLTAPSGDKDESETEPLSADARKEKSRNAHLTLQPIQTETRVQNTLLIF